MERLTSWDDPFPGDNKTNPQSPARPIPPKLKKLLEKELEPKKPALRRFKDWMKKTWTGKPWIEKPVIYLWYLGIIGTQVLSINAVHRGSHSMNYFVIGLNVGIIFMTWFDRRREGLDKDQEEWREMMHKMDVDHAKAMAEIETEARIRDEYAKKWAA